MSFIIVERGFEYDDENYEATEGGKPVLSFTDRTRADEVCAEKNRDVHKTHGYLFPYGFEYDEQNTIIEIAKTLYPDRKSRYSKFWDASSVTPAEYAQIAADQGISLKVFNVVEVPDAK